MSARVALVGVAFATLGCSSPAAPIGSDATIEVDATVKADATVEEQGPAVVACDPQPGAVLERTGAALAGIRDMSRVRAAAGSSGIGVLWQETLDDGRIRLRLGLDVAAAGVTGEVTLWTGAAGERVANLFLVASNTSYVAVFDVWRGELSDPDFSGKIMAVTATPASGVGLVVGEPRSLLSNAVAPFVAARGSRISLLAADVSDPETPLLLRLSLDASGEPSGAATVVAPLFGAVRYGWFGLVLGADASTDWIVVRRDSDSRLFRVEAGQPAPVTDLGVNAVGLSQNGLAGIPGLGVVVLSRGSGGAVLAHFWSWPGQLKWSTALTEADAPLHGVAEWNGRLGAVVERPSLTDADAVEVQWRWLEPAGAPPAQTLGETKVYGDGEITGYSDGPRVVLDDRLHVVVPTYAKAGDRITSFDVRRRLACLVR